MYTIKKMFMTLSLVLFITLGFSHTAYATELTNPETVDNIDNIDNIDNTDNIDNADDIEEVGDIENFMSEGTAEDEDSSSDGQEMYDPELYEKYEDEQGQVYYIEKKPVEPEAEDVDDVIQEDEQEDVKGKKPSYTKKELRLLSCLVYTEAGNQSDEGMIAVANVVLNRAKSSVYDHVNTIKEVIYDKKWNVQFSVTKKDKTGKSLLDKALIAYDTGVFTQSNPAAEKKAMDRAIKAAKAALNGENIIGDYLCFRVNNKEAKKVKSKYKDYRVLGDHIFYRTKQKIYSKLYYFIIMIIVQLFEFLLLSYPVMCYHNTYIIYFVISNPRQIYIYVSL